MSREDYPEALQALLPSVIPGGLVGRDHTWRGLDAETERYTCSCGRSSPSSRGLSQHTRWNSTPYWERAIFHAETLAAARSAE